MTEDNTTEVVEPQKESNSDESNALIQSLRQQIKEKDRELKSVPSRSEIEAEVRSALERDRSIQDQLVALGQPAGLSETIEGKLGGADVTREKVAEVLTAIGFQVSATDDGGQETEQAINELSQVANLGSSVAQAATGSDQQSVTDKINAAQTPEELTNIMREAGLGQ